MTQVRILSGSYRSKPVKNTVFTLVKGFQKGAKGCYVTVENDGQFAIDIPVVKVKVDSIKQLQFLNGAEAAEAAPVVADEPVVQETDVQVMDRIGTRFGVLDEMSSAVIDGKIRAMIVTGPPGVGKSFGVTQKLEKDSMFRRLAGGEQRYKIVKGAISGIGLFALLYKYSDANNVLVFDDCDVWEDADALNVLKGALDSSKKRTISWNKDSALLRLEGIPNSFDFCGSVIFITNLDFSERRSKKIAAHVDALQSRCHFLDLTINTAREKMLRIRQVYRDSDLFIDYDFTRQAGEEILDFMWENHTVLREISMRMAIKIADLVNISPTNWRTLAKATCTKEAK